MSKPTLKVLVDNTDELMKALRALRRDSVQVGIPAEDNARSSDNPIGNAGLLAIHNFGSPANNIPARPVMEIGIRLAQRAITEEFKKGAVQALSKGPRAVFVSYSRAGSIAANSIKNVITDQIEIEPLAESTLKAREAEGFSGTKALIRTGQMRNAITYVVKGEEG